MNAVEMSVPATPPVKLAEKMAKAALTSVLPMSSVQSSRLPRLRSGRILSAFWASASVPPEMTMRSPARSSDIKPSVSPENMPECISRISEIV